MSWRSYDVKSYIICRERVEERKWHLDRIHPLPVAPQDARGTDSLLSRELFWISIMFYWSMVHAERDSFTTVLARNMSADDAFWLGKSAMNWSQGMTTPVRPANLRPFGWSGIQIEVSYIHRETMGYYHTTLLFPLNKSLILCIIS